MFHLVELKETKIETKHSFHDNVMVGADQAHTKTGDWNQAKTWFQIKKKKYHK